MCFQSIMTTFAHFVSAYNANNTPISNKMQVKRIRMVLNMFSNNYDNVCVLCKRVKMQIKLQFVPKRNLNAFELF